MGTHTISRDAKMRVRPYFLGGMKSGSDPHWGWRVAWFVGLWVTGVAALGLVALLLRVIMRLAGLTS